MLTGCTDKSITTNWDDSPWKGKPPSKEVIALYGSSHTPRALYEPMHANMSSCLVCLRGMASCIKQIANDREMVEQQGRILSIGKTKAFGEQLIEWATKPAKWSKPPAFDLTGACLYFALGHAPE